MKYLDEQIAVNVFFQPELWEDLRMRYLGDFISHVDTGHLQGLQGGVSF